MAIGQTRWSDGRRSQWLRILRLRHPLHLLRLRQLTMLYHRPRRTKPLRLRLTSILRFCPYYLSQVSVSYLLYLFLVVC